MGEEPKLQEKKIHD